MLLFNIIDNNSGNICEIIVNYIIRYQLNIYNNNSNLDNLEQNEFDTYVSATESGITACNNSSLVWGLRLLSILVAKHEQINYTFQSLNICSLIGELFEKFGENSADFVISILSAGKLFYFNVIEYLQMYKFIYLVQWPHYLKEMKKIRQICQVMVSAIIFFRA